MKSGSVSGAALVATGAALLAMTLGACTPIGEQRVPDWPELQMVEHYVPHNEMRNRCSQYTGFFTSPEACAEFDFVNRRCDVWFSADFPPPEFIVTHEHRHCLGYEHAGEDDLAKAWNAYLVARRPVASASASQGSSSPPTKQP
jgi:hypothetical protein